MTILSASPTLPLVHHGGCIRFDEPYTPRIHHNESHTAVGVENVFLNSDGELEVTLEKDAAGRPRNIVFMTAQFDESMACLTTKGWSVGVTQGVGSFVIRFTYRDANGNVTTKKGNHPALYGDWNNIWFHAITIDRPIVAVSAQI